MMYANNRVHYGLMVVYRYPHIILPHYHYHADLSEGIELLKGLSDIFCLECVYKIRSVLSNIFHAIYIYIYMRLCILSLPIYLMVIVKIHVLDFIVIIKFEVWPICICLGLGHETMVCAVCLSIFLYKLAVFCVGAIFFLKFVITIWLYIWYIYFWFSVSSWMYASV